jgi:hypothetical protein
MDKEMFGKFMKDVDREMYKISLCTHMDIDDFDYADYFEGGESPIVTAKAALENAGW